MRIIFLGLLLVCSAAWAGPSKLYLTSLDVVTINHRWADYEYGSRRTGCPVEVLVAIHYREADLWTGWYSFKARKVVRNVGGPFMLDRGGKGEKFIQRIHGYEASVARLYGYRPGAHVSHDFRFACLVAGHELMTKMRKGIPCERVLADAVWGYNGRAEWQGNLTRSSYVYSDPLNGIVLTIKHQCRGRMVSTPDTRPGVMVIYNEVKDLEVQGIIGPKKN